MNQQLNAVLQLQAHSVARGVGCGNLTGCGSSNSGTGWLNRHTLAQLASRENRVRNIGQSNGGTLNRGVQLNDLTGCSGSRGGRSCGLSLGSLLGLLLYLLLGGSSGRLFLRALSGVLSGVVLRLVTEDQHTGHRAEEGNSQANHVQVRGLHSRNRQQRGERKGVGLNAQHRNGRTTDHGGNQNNRNHALVAEYHTVHGRLRNTAQQTGHRRTDSGLA